MGVNLMLQRMVMKCSPKEPHGNNYRGTCHHRHVCFFCAVTPCIAKSINSGEARALKAAGEG